jgi:rhamnosyl/mannosyltransferase
MTKAGNAISVLQVGKFYPPYAGGIETHLQQLCTHLQRFADIRVVVANMDRHSVTEEVSGIKVHRAGTPVYVGGAPVSPGMVTAIRCSPAHIVHIHWPNPAAVLAYLASGHTGQLVLTYHSDIVRQKVGASLFGPILNLVMARCAAVICTSPNYLETSPILRRFQKTCHVIPYGIETEKLAIRNDAMVEKLRRQYGQRIVLAVGRLVYYKGFEYLIQAMRFVDGRAVIVGDGPLREKLQRLSVGCGVADRVIFAGEKHGEDLAAYFHAADVFALPSIARSEAFGIVQLEAMACGKPVINTRLDSGVPAVSLDRITGVTVPPANSESLARAINNLLENGDLRSRYGKAGQMRVAQEFTVETMAQRTWQLYRRILESAPVVQQQERARKRQHATMSQIWDETSI